MPGLLWKRGIEQRLQFGAIELADVKVILDQPSFVVDGSVGRGNDQHAHWRQHPAEFREHFALERQMLDGLEGHDDVDTSVGQRELRDGALDIGEIVRRIAFTRMRHRVRGDVDACHMRGGTRKQKTAIAFAARGIEHAQAAHDRRDERVAMPVLVPDRSAHLRRETLAGEGERGGGGREGGQGDATVGKMGDAHDGHRVQLRIVAVLRCAAARPGSSADPRQESVRTTGW